MDNRRECDFLGEFMEDKIVIESDTMSWYENSNLCVQVRDESRIPGECAFIHIKSKPYGDELNLFKNKRLRVTIEVIGDNVR